MANSNTSETTPANQGSGLVEVVRPDDGRQESFWLIGTISVVLLIAAVVLQFNQTAVEPEKKHLSLDVQGKAVLTALSIAADEILFLSDGEALPSVPELIEQEIPPFFDSNGTFASYSWIKPQADCYFGRSSNHVDKDFLVKVAHGDAHVYWREAGATTPDCQHLTQWQTTTDHD